MWNNIFISSDGKTFDFHFLFICLASGQTADVDLPSSRRKHALEFFTPLEPHTSTSGHVIIVDGNVSRRWTSIALVWWRNDRPIDIDLFRCISTWNVQISAYLIIYPNECADTQRKQQTITHCLQQFPLDMYRIRSLSSSARVRKHNRWTTSERENISTNETCHSQSSWQRRRKERRETDRYAEQSFT